MQIIESSALGVRAAVHCLAHRGSALEFTLFPMLHIGEQSFYDAVRARLNDCDVVLYEGVGSVRARTLTLAYRWAAKRHRLGLVCQSEALPRDAIEAKLVHADLSAPEFDAFWRQVPWWQRAAFFVGAPALGIYDYLTLTRRALARRCGLDDLRSRDDALSLDEGFERLDEAILTRRDGRLLAAVLRCHEAGESRPRRAAVLFGAAHIPAVLRFLDRLGYRVTRSDWLTVFEL